MQAPLCIKKDKKRQDNRYVQVAIIGGGAAGMLCGVYAARRGHQVHILEKMRNSEKSFSLPERDDATSPMIPIPKNFFPAVMSNRKFLYSAFYTYGSRDVMEFLRRQECR